MATPQNRRRVPESEFHKSIEVVARGLSRERKVERLLDLNVIDQIPSTEEEQATDWRNAVIFWADRLMTRAHALGDLERSSYKHFEGVWLGQVREHRAYFQWINGRDSQTFWTSQYSRELHYLWACEELRDFLVSGGSKEPLESFSEAKLYLQEKKYFGEDAADTRSLTYRKAERLAPHLGWEQASKQAQEFVVAFYGNIVQAISAADKRNATFNVLRAVQHGGSRPKAPDIINGFELLLMVLFLDRHIIEEIWASGQLPRESTL
jgi:hypothetical protein